MLRYWVDDPLALTARMNDVGAVISGSVALAFAIQPAWSSNDLDIYVPVMRRYEILSHLVGKEGYHVVQTDVAYGAAYPFYKRVISSVTKVRKPGKGHPSIDIIESLTVSALTPIVWFPGTWAINWIDQDGLVMAYPELTLQGRGFVTRLLDTMRMKERRWVYKYQTRGIRAIDPRDQPIRPGQPCGPTCVGRARTTDDSLCMQVPFRDPPIRHPIPPVTWTIFPKLFQARLCSNPFCPMYLYHQKHHVPSVGV